MNAYQNNSVAEGIYDTLDGMRKEGKNENMLRNAYNADGLMPFPKELSIKRIREELQEKQNVQRLYSAGPEVRNCTNAWITGNVFEDIQTAAEEISKASDVVLNSMNMS